MQKMSFRQVRDIQEAALLLRMGVFINAKYVLIQGVPPIGTQLQSQFLIFLIFLSKETMFAIKTQMV